jgi:hypothetical protein
MSVLAGKADLAGSWFIRKILEIKSENPLRHAPHCHDAPVPVANLTRNVDSVRTERPVEMMTDACLHAVLSFEVLALAVDGDAVAAGIAPLFRIDKLFESCLNCGLE